MLTFTILTEDDGNADRVIQKTLSAMEAAIEINQMWLKEHPSDVCFLTCGTIDYDFAQESLLSKDIPIKTIPILKKTKIGLCIDFVAFDVAVRRMMGSEAEPDVAPTGKPGLFHITTAVIDGGGDVIIDPTKEIIESGRYLSAPSICEC